MGEATGYVGGEYSIGIAYKEGFGVPQNFDEAFEWLEKAANKNYALAQSELSSFYQKGLGSITKDLDTTFIWLKKSAENGNYIAQRVLGHHYRLGTPANKLDEEQAISWFEKSAAQGDLEACEWAGTLHLKQENFKGAAFFLSLAKKMGNKEAEKLWDKHELWNYGNFE